MPSPDSKEPRPVPRRAGLPALAVILLALLAALLLLYGPHRVRPAAPPARLDPALVRQALRAEAAAAARVTADDPAAQQLDAALRARARAELQEIRRPGENPAVLQQAPRRCQALMADLLVRLGAPRYRELAAFQAERVVAALQAALPALAAAGGVHAFLARRTPGSAAARDAEEAYGSFLLRVALPGQLVGEDGRTDPDLAAYARAVVLYRLLEEPARLAGVALPLEPAARRIFLHWKVERAAAAPAPARRRALEELQRLEPGYVTPPATAGSAVRVGE